MVAQVTQADAELGQALCISPVEAAWAWAGYPLRCWLAEQCPDQTPRTPRTPRRSQFGNEPSPLTFLAFSAGCVAAASVAHYWVQQGGRVNSIIAVDGWGVPLVGPFQVHRLSHDFLTHAMTASARPGQAHFYAAPAVPHLKLWQDPDRVAGWGLPPSGVSGSPHSPVATTALSFLLQCLDPMKHGLPATSREDSYLS